MNLDAILMGLAVVSHVFVVERKVGNTVVGKGREGGEKNGRVDVEKGRYRGLKDLGL